MSAYKNQHFVPRAHLKPFTLGAAGSSISLFNSKHGKFIYNAPVKNQCSRNFFYGRDLRLEHSLGQVEEEYASIIRRICEAGSERPTLSVSWLRLFWCVQWARTETAAQHAKALNFGMAEKYDIPQFVNHGPDHNWVMVPMSAFRKAHEYASDLAHVIVRNRTDLPFITSDNPAIVTNKLHIIERNVRFRPWGIGSAGAMLMLPLTPDHAVVFYDSDVYKVDDRNGWIDVKNVSDVRAINEHQVLNCGTNVYFSSERSHEWISAAFAEHVEQRSQPVWRFHYGVLDDERNGVQRFRMVDTRDPAKDRQAIIITEGVPRRPVSWPAFIRWHPRGFAFDTGNGHGWVRRSHVVANPLQSYRRVRIGR